MFEKILLPLDGSKRAEASVSYGEEFARRLGSSIVLLHICEPEDRQSESIHKAYLDILAERLGHDIRESQPKDEKIKIIVKIEKGQPSETIGRVVKEGDIGLIIMTNPSASGDQTAKLGYTIDHVLRTVTIPVMIIKPDSIEQIESKKQPINRILVPLDGSDLSKQALSAAEELASRLKIPITLFQMTRAAYPYGGEPAPFVDYDKLTREEEQKVIVEMTVLEKDVKNRDLIVNWDVTTGTDAAKEIIKESENFMDGLVIMSTHGRSGLKRWLFGSVAEAVLRHGSAPLLLIHPKAS